MASHPELDENQLADPYGPTTTQRRIEGGLVSALSADNPVLALARKSGERSGYAKGLGPSSYSARAAEGEAMRYVTPLVTEAVKLESQLEESQRERVFAGGEAGKVREFQAGETALGREATASESELARLGTASETALGREAIASESELARKSAEAEAELNRQFAAAEAQLGRQLTSAEAALVREQNEALQTQRIEADRISQEAAAADSAELQAAEIAFKEAAQATDIEYKEWLEDVTFGHERLLSADRQASDVYKTYLEGITQIFANPDSTTAQKQAAANALKEGTTENLVLIETTTGIDLSAFLPPGAYDADNLSPPPPPSPNYSWLATF